MFPTAALKNVLTKITVKVRDVQKINVRIITISDDAMSLPDGTLSLGDDIIILGEKLKVDQNDRMQGVFSAPKTVRNTKRIGTFRFNTSKTPRTTMPYLPLR